MGVAVLAEQRERKGDLDPTVGPVKRLCGRSRSRERSVQEGQRHFAFWTPRREWSMLTLSMYMRLHDR